MPARFLCLFLIAGALNAGVAQAVGIRLVLNDRAATRQGVITSAMVVVKRAFSAASVRTEWDWASQGAARPMNVYVHLLPDLMTATVTGEGSCGMANAAAATVWISVACAERLASSGLTNQVGRVLGYLIAHEVGHVLLADHRHDGSGLMRSDWGRGELMELESGRLRFEAPGHLQQRAQRWIASRMQPDGL